MSTPSDAQLWARIGAGGWDDLSMADAVRLVELRLPLSERKRAYRLGLLVQENRLTAAERGELERLREKGQLLTLMKARARLLLGGPSEADPTNIPRRGNAPARRPRQTS